MSPSTPDTQEPPARASATLLATALVSAAVIACEVVLMRRLLVERWHHFGYLVISVALLGFGISGTVLALTERRVRAKPERTLSGLAVTLALTFLVAPRLATLLPVTARFIPADLWAQAGWWCLYWLAALTPFLIGAAFLGAALLTAEAQVGRVYAANLFGSGLGATGAALLVSRMKLEHTLWPSFALALAAVLVLSLGARRGPQAPRRIGGIAATLLLVGLAVALEAHWPLVPAYDVHKYAAWLQQLVAQGSARRLAARTDPHGYVEVYESSLFHDLPFLALSAPPPPMYSLVVNGDAAGSVLRIDSEAQAHVMDRTLMAFPYELIRRAGAEASGPTVLLIGETGGADVWLARRQRAARIDVVQPNRAIISLWTEYAGPLLKGPALHIYPEDPRSFLRALGTGASSPANAPATYDLIQIVALQGLGVGAAGTRGLAEDHLVTVEGFADCLRALRDDGCLAISRGIQQPERENIRLFATLVEALESLGVDNPARHMIQVRDYLGVCTIAARAPLSEARRETLLAAVHAFDLTPIWYDGLPIEAVNRPDALDGPPGTTVDWLHHAAREILSPRRGQFYESWLLNVRPARDDSPFFWDFFKLRAVAELRRAYGDLWLTRAELGRLFLYASLVVAGGAGLLLILVPLAVAELGRPGATVQRIGPDAGAGAGPTLGRLASVWVMIYFGTIGLGFMGIEMALISRAIHWLGDPVTASALVIGGVLMVSGCGSLTGDRLIRGNVWLAPAAVALIAVVVRAVGWGTRGAGLAEPSVLLVCTLPLAYFMGMPMPVGLALLNARRPRLVPWAWGVNGVASVLATSLALVVAMAAGYRAVLLLAATAYALAAGLAAAVRPGPACTAARGPSVRTSTRETADYP